MPERADFGAVLRRWRVRAGISQGALAVQAGCSQRHFSFVENGRARPSRDFVERVAHALRMRPGDGNALLRLAGYAETFHTPAPAPETAGVMIRFVGQVLSGAMPAIAALVDERGRVVMMNRMAAELYALSADIEDVWEDGALNLFRAALHPDGMRRAAFDPAVLGESLVQALVRMSWRDAELYEGMLRRLYLYPGMDPDWRRPCADATPPPLVALSFRLRGRLLALQMPAVLLSPPQPFPDALFPEMRLAVGLPADEATKERLREIAAEIAPLPPHERLSPFIAQADV